MKNPNLRRIGLVSLTRQPAPLSYDYAPRNRKQRRVLERELRRNAKKTQGER